VDAFGLSHCGRAEMNPAAYSREKMTECSLVRAADKVTGLHSSRCHLRLHTLIISIKHSAQ
jgi:hypothetical protein